MQENRRVGSDSTNRITLQYFDGCPNWQTTDRILSALAAEGWRMTVEHEVIDTYEMAEERGFSGSPTVLINGVDPFADEDARPALACRIYQTETGPAGSPSARQLRRTMVEPPNGNSGADQD